MNSTDSKQYSINDKNSIQKQFKKKIKSIRKGTKTQQDYDWSEIEQLFTKIFNIFND